MAAWRGTRARHIDWTIRRYKYWSERNLRSDLVHRRMAAASRKPALTRHPPAMPIDCDPKQRWSSVLRACLLITVVPLAVHSQGGGYRRPSWTPCCPPHSTLSLNYCLPPPAPATSKGGRWPTCATFESFGLCHDYGHSKEVELVAKGVCRHTCDACPWPGNAAVYDVARSIGAEIRLPYTTGHEKALAAAPTCEMLDDPSRAAECSSCGVAEPTLPAGRLWLRLTTTRQ